MNEETNENIDGVIQTSGNVENAFSDLISEYFENGGVTATTNVEINTKTIDWDSVNNGQLYTNLANNTVQNGDTPVTDVTANNIQNTPYTNVNASTVVDGTTETTTTGTLYTNLNTTESTNTVNTTVTTYVTGGTEGTNIVEPTTEASQTGGYGTIYNDIEGINNVTAIPSTDTVIVPAFGDTVGTDTTDTVTTGTNATEFKLTQANLPAKIGFWTKVRNFFMPEARINYSLQQPTTNTGLWNKVQSFFSFGKNK